MSNWEYDYSNLYGGQSGQNNQSNQDNQDSRDGGSAPAGQSSQPAQPAAPVQTGAGTSESQGASQQPAGGAGYTGGSYGAGSGSYGVSSGSYGAHAPSGASGGYGTSGGYGQGGYGSPASGGASGGYGGFTHGSYQYGGQPPKPPKAPKTPRKWPKRVGAAALALAVCVGAGFGGGYLGTLAANSAALASASSDTSSSQATGTTTTPAPATEAGALTTTQIASMVGPSVVEVTTEIATMNPFFGQYVESGAGSGVIISEDGYIITNNHVVEGASNVTVTTQDRQSYTATVVGADEQSDIAVLKIDATGLTPATIGDSDQLAVGEFVLAVGNPLGTLGGTVTDGIISALNREVTIENQTMTLLQMDAAVSPGNSGGGLFNAKGELIGIVNAKSGGDDVEGIGFAIPINDAMEVAQSLMTNGYVAGRPAMGVSVIEIGDLSTAMQYGVSQLGVYIAEVTEGGAADQAGLQPGDLLVSIDGTAVTSTSEVTSLLQDHEVGDQIEVQVQRDRQLLSVTVTLQDAALTTTQNAESTAASASESRTLPQEDWNPFGGRW